jgi:NAD-dependent DNA ligase
VEFYFDKVTDYVLTGENETSKIGKANKLNITIISETDFMELISKCER